MGKFLVGCTCGRQFKVELGMVRATFACDQCGCSILLPAANEVGDAAPQQISQPQTQRAPIQQPVAQQNPVPQRTAQRSSMRTAPTAGRQTPGNPDFNWRLVSIITAVGVIGIIAIALIVFVTSSDNSTATASATTPLVSPNSEISITGDAAATTPPTTTPPINSLPGNPSVTRSPSTHSRPTNHLPTDSTRPKSSERLIHYPKILPFSERASGGLPAWAGNDFS